MSRPAPTLMAAIAYLALSSPVVQAKSTADFLQDTKDYFTSPLRWDSHDWGVAGATLLGIAGAYALDDTVHNRIAGDAVATTHHNEGRDALPLAAMLAGTFAVGLTHGNEQELGTGRDMMEAVVLTGLSTQAFKVASGRKRPWESDSPDRWGHGGSSFPSGHTSMAFAAAQVLADELPRDRWGWRAIVYGLAGLTAYARMDSNAHWLSDTVAGAALGIATGRFVSRRGADPDSKLALSVVPIRGGAMLSLAIDTN